MMMVKYHLFCLVMPWHVLELEILVCMLTVLNLSGVHAGQFVSKDECDWFGVAIVGLFTFMFMAFSGNFPLPGVVCLARVCPSAVFLSFSTR
jgi:hypothetical protein